MPDRVDLPPDPYIRMVKTSRVRDPHREDSIGTISSTRPQQRARAVVTRSTAFLIISDNTVTAVDFNTEEIDNIGLHDLVTNNSRLTIPSSGRITGLWLLHGHVIWTAAATGTSREIDIRKNGSLVIAQVASPSLGTAIDHSMDVWRFVDDPEAADYFELTVFQDSGGDLNLLTTTEKTYFEIIHLW